MGTAWHAKTAEETLEILGTSAQGLTSEEAARRSQEYGPNKLPEAHAEGYPAIFARQLRSPLIYVLVAAAATVLAMGETSNAVIILAVLLFNALVGTVQEGRAQNTLRALKRLAETTAVAQRDGADRMIPDREIVPGDIILLAEGAKVPADARLLSSRDLKVDEASLTGESIYARKDAGSLVAPESIAAERKNMVFKGTHVTGGTGRAVVVATGSATEIGIVAREVAAIDTEIPLKADIRNLSRAIITVVAFMSVLLFILGILFGTPARTMFATVVSLAVSVIPEGLPIVITLVLASGVWRMSQRHALVKKLQAVEALGQARVIAVDKTGTLTRNELVVTKVWSAGTLFEISGAGYEPAGDVRIDGQTVDAAAHPQILLAGKAAAFCASARTQYSEEEGLWRVSGEPTEAALFVLGEKLGFKKDPLEAEYPLVDEIPFDYKTRYHATVHATDKGRSLVVVGAPEAVIPLCGKIRRGTHAHEMTGDGREEIERVLSGMLSDGLRVLAFATADDAPAALSPEDMPELVFDGFFGMEDALRPEAKGAVARAQQAGMRVVMITGDHALTARAIARAAGIWREEDALMTGAEMDALSDAELAAQAPRVSVFARVTPEHKLRIIGAFRAGGEIVAMTGDGVNDAPSLVAADLGVAMGKAGTEVAKEAADIVLLDDDFGTIVAAVEEGRSIYKNIKKVILYLFSTSLGEVLVIAASLPLGLPLPILAAQIIWLNFVTDGFLDVALAMEPKEKGLLSGAFGRSKRQLLDRAMIVRMGTMALPMAAGALALFALYAGQGDMTKAWTVSLTVLAAFQWFNAWNARSEEGSVFASDILSNKFLIGATAIVISLHMLAIYAPPMQRILSTTALSAADWILIVPVAFSIVVVEEIRKYAVRRAMARTSRAIIPAASALTA